MPRLASEGHRGAYAGDGPAARGGCGEIRCVCHTAIHLFQLWNGVPAGKRGTVGGYGRSHGDDYLRLYHGSQGDSLETPSGVFHDQQSVVYSAGSVDDESSGAGGRLKPHGLSRIYEDLFLLLRGSCDASDRKDIRL